MKPWSTIRSGISGAVAGVAYAALNSVHYWSRGPEWVAQGAGELFGGAVGGFMLVAMVCGIRNIVVRAKSTAYWDNWRSIMEEYAKPLDLFQSESGYILRKTITNGDIYEIVLSDDDVLTLAQSAPQMALAVLSKQNQAANPVSAILVRNLSLNTDHHRSELHLEIETQSYGRMIAAIPLPLAQSLSARLPSYLATMAQEAPKRHN